MRQTTAIILATILLALAAPSATGRTIVVAKDGSGDYKYLQPAVDNAVAGDVVEVGPGLYDEWLMPESGVSIVGTDPTEVVVRYERAYDVITLDGVEDVRIEGITLAHFYAPTPCSAPAVKISKSRNIVIERCHIIGCGLEGVWCLNSENVTIRNNRIFDNVRRGVGLICTEGFEVAGNVIFDNHAGVEIVGGSGTVVGNTFVRHAQYAIYVSGTKDGDATVTVANNIVDGAVYGFLETVPEGRANAIDCSANCFAGCAAASYALRRLTQQEMQWWNKGPVSFFLTEGPEYVFFDGAVLEGVGGDIRFRKSKKLLVEGIGSLAAWASFDSDAVFGTRTSEGACLFWKTGTWTPCDGSAEWIAALDGTTRIEGAVLADPGFTDRAGNDFRLCEDSPCMAGGREGGMLGAVHTAAHAERSGLMSPDD